MPHIIVEYSSDLGASLQKSTFLAELSNGLDNIIDFPKRSLKLRSTSYDTYYCIDNPEEEKSPFAHITLKLLTGRTVDARKAASELLLANAAGILGEGVSLSVDVVEMQRETYAKT